MEQMSYEPFGERLAPERDARPRSPVSRYLLWAGTGLFWSLVVTIVLARAAFFEAESCGASSGQNLGGV